MSRKLAQSEGWRCGLVGLQAGNGTRMNAGCADQSGINPRKSAQSAFIRILSSQLKGHEGAGDQPRPVPRAPVTVQQQAQLFNRPFMFCLYASTPDWP